MDRLTGKVAIVTGASRGVGKGIALGLGEYGATVYVAGRTEKEEGLPPFLSGTTILKTAQEVTAKGGLGIAHRCDVRNDKEMEALFSHVRHEQGRLDILVNSAWSGGDHVMDGTFFNTPFYEQPMSLFDDLYTVGLRSNYAMSRFAAKMMAEQGDGLIVNISFFSARRYWLNVSHGVFKAATDKMSADTAFELKNCGVRVFSLYPGTVRTEGMLELAKYDRTMDLNSMESPQFLGRCVAELFSDQQNQKESGRALIAAEIGERYGIRDIDGKQPVSLRSALW